ncbi:MAG: ester cyclase [Pseudomonadota bacterium]
MSNGQIVREACRVIWSEGQLERIEEFYADDYTADYPRTDWGTGIDGIRALATSIRMGFPDYREEIEELIEAGDRVVVQLKIRGTHRGTMDGMPPTGRAVEFRDVTLLTLRNGKIIAQRGLSDHFALYQQLGLITLPGPAGDSV